MKNMQDIIEIIFEDSYCGIEVPFNSIFNIALYLKIDICGNSIQIETDIRNKLWTSYLYQ